jgi:hypothetical protein
MVGEVFAGLSAFKSMLDIAKSLKDINDATIRNEAVIDLQDKILTAREQQTKLLERISELEKQVASFETWDAEKQRYELKDLGFGSLVYMLKREARGTELPHWVCARCYGDRRISIIQYTSSVKNVGHGYFCPACHIEIIPAPVVFDSTGKYRWLD